MTLRRHTIASMTKRSGGGGETGPHEGTNQEHGGEFLTWGIPFEEAAVKIWGTIDNTTGELIDTFDLGPTLGQPEGLYHAGITTAPLPANGMRIWVTHFKTDASGNAYPSGILVNQTAAGDDSSLSGALASSMQIGGGVSVVGGVNQINATWRAAPASAAIHTAEPVPISLSPNTEYWCRVTDAKESFTVKVYASDPGITASVSASPIGSLSMLRTWESIRETDLWVSVVSISGSDTGSGINGFRWSVVTDTTTDPMIGTGDNNPDGPTATYEELPSTVPSFVLEPSPSYLNEIVEMTIDGRYVVYAYTGVSGASYYDTVWIFDTQDQSWTSAPTDPSLNLVYAFPWDDTHVAYYATGGTPDLGPTIRLFEPGTGVWSLGPYDAASASYMTGTHLMSPGPDSIITGSLNPYPSTSMQFWHIEKSTGVMSALAMPEVVDPSSYVALNYLTYQGAAKSLVEGEHVIFAVGTDSETTPTSYIRIYNVAVDKTVTIVSEIPFTFDPGETGKSFWSAVLSGEAPTTTLEWGIWFDNPGSRYTVVNYSTGEVVSDTGPGFNPDWPDIPGYIVKVDFTKQMALPEAALAAIYVDEEWAYYNAEEVESLPADKCRVFLRHNNELVETSMAGREAFLAFWHSFIDTPFLIATHSSQAVFSHEWVNQTYEKSVGYLDDVGYIWTSAGKFTFDPAGWTT